MTHRPSTDFRNRLHEFKFYSCPADWISIALTVIGLALAGVASLGLVIGLLE